MIPPALPALALAAAALLAAPSGRAAAGPRVAVLPALTLPAEEELGLEARSAAEKAIRAQGGEPVPLVPSAADVSCRAAPCIEEIGRKAMADHLLRLEARYERDGFQLRIELWDAAGGRLVEAKERQCEVCTMGDLQKAIRELTTLVTAPVLAAAASSPAKTGRGGGADAGADGRQGRRWAPAVALATGGALLAATGLLLTMHGRPFDCQTIEGQPVCSRLRDTRMAAAMTGALGLAAVGGGLWLWLGTERASDRAGLAWVPGGGLLVRGRF
jgi:hypothetical protein